MVVSFFIKKAVAGNSSYIQALLSVELETILDELFAFIWDQSLLGCWEVDWAGFEHDSFVQNPDLAHLVPERLLSIQHLIVDYSDRPHIYFRSDDGFLVIDETLWR